MPESDLASALNEGIEALRAGESVDDALRRYPEHRAELEPLLRLVVEVRSMTRPALSAAAARVGEARVRRAAATRRRPRIYRPALGWVAAALVMLLLLGLGTTVAAAQGRPESPLYGLRVAAERIQQAIALAPSAQADSHLAGVERRLDELATEVATTGRPPARPAFSDLDEKLRTALDKVEELPPPEAASRINRAIGLIARERAIIRAGDDNEVSSDRVEQLNRRETELTEKLRRLSGTDVSKTGPPADRGREGARSGQGGQNPAGHSGPGRGR